MLNLRDSTNEAIENTLRLPPAPRAKIKIIQVNANINSQKTDEVEARIEANLNRLLQETQEEKEHDEVIPISSEDLRQLFSQPQPTIKIPSFEETVEKAKKSKGSKEVKEIEDTMGNYTEEQQKEITYILKQRLYVYMFEKIAESFKHIEKTYAKSFLLV